MYRAKQHHTAMNILFVYAHNEPKSFCHAMLNHAVDLLNRSGHQVQVSDLYAMNFNPVASAGDFSHRQNPDYLVYALEQRHNDSNHGLAPDIVAEVEKMFWADLIIFHFPLYWFSVPAIMKGWFDRVLLSGRCYGGRYFYNHGKMAGKRATLTITAGSRAHFFDNPAVAPNDHVAPAGNTAPPPAAIHGDWQTMLSPLLQGTLAYVGFDVLPPFTAWQVPYVDDATRQTMLVPYGKWLTDLDKATPLIFPKKEDFGL